MSSDRLWDMIVSQAGSSRSSLHCWVGDHFDMTPWPDVVRDAEMMTGGLRRHGVRPGTRVATVLTNTPHTVRGILGVWLAGGAVASLPVPARGMDGDEYGRQLMTICEQIQPEVFLVEQAMLGVLPEQLRARVDVQSWESLAGTGRVDPTPPGEDELAFIQYSSGSTSTPKGCMLTPRAIAAQLEIVQTMTDSRPERDVCVSWLPLSHDMGMFGCLMTSWASGWELYLSTPQRFTFAPRSWFSDLANYRGTITGGTSTALHLGARAHAGRAARISGELVTRCFVVGAERVEQSTLQYAAEVFGPYGFRAESFMPSYGLAEATLAATATPVTEAPRHLVVDAIALADGELQEVAEGSEFATAVVSSGVPCKGVELVGASSGVLTEICVRTPSLAAGYFCDEQRTNERFVDNSVRTADIGFVREGYLYPVGRLDDVISVAGRKVYAREIENAVDAVDGVRRGCSTLIGGDGGRALTLFVEVKNGLKDYRSLAEEFASVAMSKAAVALDECVFLGRNSLPKTPSGKIQRHRCRQLFDAGRFKPLATVHLGAVA